MQALVLNESPLCGSGRSNLNLISGVPSPFYGTYRDQNIGERTTESPPRYVALRDLFLPQENHVKTTPVNRQHSTRHDPFVACNLIGDRRQTPIDRTDRLNRGHHDKTNRGSRSFVQLRRWQLREANYDGRTRRDNGTERDSATTRVFRFRGERSVSWR